MRALPPVPAFVLALVALAALVAAGLACLGSAGATPPAPDLALTIQVEPLSGAVNLTAGEPARVTALVENHGSADAAAFEVDLWANNTTGAIWTRHSLNVTGLAAGANITLVDPTPFELPIAGLVYFHGIADPADRVADAFPANNADNRQLEFKPPPADETVVDAGEKLAATRTLPAYSFLALRVVAGEGDSIIFQADSEGGAPFDCYLMNADNFTLYLTVRERPDPNTTVQFFDAYSHAKTDHIAYTTDPMPAGTYFAVIENDDRLQGGASPAGAVSVKFAVALVNNSLPPAAIAVIIGAAAAAVWATIRWRPVFDVRSPILEVPAPDAGELGEDDEAAGAGGPHEPSPSEMEEGEGPPPHGS